MTELKPCPFCGGEAQLKKIGDAFTVSRTVAVKCSTPGCFAEQKVGGIRNSLQWAEEKAINKWNTRSLPWQPIETAPKGCHDIFLVASRKYYPPYVVVNASKNCQMKEEYPFRTHLCGNLIEKSKATHWMPLPPPPEGGKK